MATLPIPGLLAEFKILGLQAMDFGAQLSHFRARVLHWGVQLREEMTGKTDLCQLAVHDHLGLTKIAPKGKGLVLLQPEQKNQKERDGQRFTIVRVFIIVRIELMTKKCRGPTAALTAEKTSECLLLATKRLFSSSGSGSCTS